MSYRGARRFKTHSASGSRRTLASTAGQPRRGSKSVDSSSMVSDALMSELKYQMRNAQQRHLAVMERERRHRMEVDYTWLTATPTSDKRPHEIPEMKRIELEQLCSRVDPSDCGTVILSFRRALDEQRLHSVELIPNVLRSIVCATLSESSPAESVDNRPLKDRVTRSLSNLRLRPGARVSVAPASVSGIEESRDSACDLRHSAVASASLSNSTGSDVDVCSVFTTSTARSHSMLALNTGNS